LGHLAQSMPAVAGRAAARRSMSVLAGAAGEVTKAAAAAARSAGSEAPGLEVPWQNGRSVFRQLLRAARHYPSRKRDDMINDIRLDFKDHKDTADPKLLLRYRSQALSGLQGLLQYSSARHGASDGDWQVGPVKHPDPTDMGKAPTHR